MAGHAFARISALTLAATVAGCAGSPSRVPTPIRATPTTNPVVTATCEDWLSGTATERDEDLRPLYDAVVHDLLANPGLVQPGAAIQGPVHAVLDDATTPAARRYVTKVCGTQFGSANLVSIVFTFFLQAPDLPPGLAAGRP